MNMESLQKLISKLKIYYIFVKEFKYKVLILFGMLFINMVLSSISITMIMPVINILIDQKPSDIRIVKYIYKFFDLICIVPSLLNVLIIFFLIVLVNNIIVYFESLLRAKIQTEMTFDAGNKIFKNLMKVSYSFYHGTKKGDIYYYVSGAACYLKFSLFHIMELVFEIFLIVGYTIILLSISTKLTILVSLLGLFSVIIYKKFIFITKKLTEEQTILNQIFNSMFVDTIDGIKVVKSYNREKYELDKFNTNWGNYLNVLYKSYKNTAIISSCSSPVSFLIIISLLIYAHLHLKLPFSLLSVYMLLIYKLIPVFQKLPTIINSLFSTLAPVDIALEAISEENKPYLKNGDQYMPSFKSDIILKQVSFKNKQK